MNLYFSFERYTPSPDAPKTTSTSSSAATSSTSQPSSSTAPSSGTPAAVVSTHKTSNAPAIGGAIAAVIVVTIAILAVWLLLRRRRSARRRGPGVLDDDLRNSPNGSITNTGTGAPPAPALRITYGLPVSYVVEELPPVSSRDPSGAVGTSVTDTGQHNFPQPTAAQGPEWLIPPATSEKKVADLPRGARSPNLPTSGAFPPSSPTPAQSGGPEAERVVQRLLAQGVPLPQIASFIGLLSGEPGPSTSDDDGGRGRTDITSTMSDAGTSSAPPVYDYHTDGKG